MQAAPRFAGLTAAALVASVALAACGGADDSSSSDSTPDASSTSLPTPSTTLKVPDGATLTSPGTRLKFGDTATVAYELKDSGTILDLTVTSAKQGSLKDFAGFNLEKSYEKKASYYYVRVGVKNAGTKKFGGVDVPLWGISGNNTLLPPVRFTSAFAKCPTQTLPKKFAPGDKFSTCLVFLSPNHGALNGVSYRPTEEFVPIEWHGKVEKPATQKKAEKGKKKPKKGGKNQG